MDQEEKKIIYDSPNYSSNNLLYPVNKAYVSNEIIDVDSSNNSPLEYSASSTSYEPSSNLGYYNNYYENITYPNGKLSQSAFVLQGQDYELPLNLY